MSYLHDHAQSNNNHVPHNTYCIPCGQYIDGDDIRWLWRRDEPTRWCTVTVSFDRMTMRFSCHANQRHAGPNMPPGNDAAGQNDYRRFYDLRTCALSSTRKMFYLDLYKDAQGNNIGIRHHSARLLVIGWQTLVQDLLTPQEAAIINIAGYPGPDPVNGRQPSHSHTFECCLDLQHVGGQYTEELFFQRPGGQATTGVPHPKDSTWHDQRFNRCYQHFTLPPQPNGPLYAGQKAYHGANQMMLDMRYGLSRQATNWVDVMIHNIGAGHNYLTDAVEIVRMNTRGTDRDWYELEGAPPFDYNRVFRVNRHTNIMGVTGWFAEWSGMLCDNRIGAPGNFLGWTHAVNQVTPQNGLLPFRNRVDRSVRRVWSHALGNFFLQFEERQFAI